MLNTPNVVPFDFLINGSFLTSSLEYYIKKQGLSLETTLELQYVKSLIPPLYKASFLHDHWVSGVDVLSESSPAGRWAGTSFDGKDRCLSASYDGRLRMWDASGQVLATSPSAHRICAKAAKFLSTSQVVSAGLDHVVRVWDYGEGGPNGSAGEFKLALELYGHRGNVSSVDVDGPSRRILTTGSAGAVALWTTSKGSAPAAPKWLLPGAAAGSSSKRPKVQASNVPQRGALAVLMPPPNPCPGSAAIFDPRDRTVAYSASQDHTIRTLDLPTAKVVSTITTPYSQLSLCALPRPGSSVSSPLLAAGTLSRNVVLADPRLSTAASIVLALRGHVSFVSAVAPSATSDHALVSASHDGTCRVWDLRAAGGAATTEAAYIIDRESLRGKKRPVAGDGCKVFGVVWDRTWGVVSCGEDKTVQVNQGSDIIAS